MILHRVLWRIYDALGRHLEGKSSITSPPLPTRAPEPIRNVGRASFNGITAVGTVRIPETVNPGDVLVLAFAGQSVPATPTGWKVRAEHVEGQFPTALVWCRMATETDPGAEVDVWLPVRGRVMLELSAYSGVQFIEEAF